MFLIYLQPSRAIEPWEGVLDATKPTVECVYFCPARQQYIGNENCLFMNIYTPDLNENAGKAVLFWIHAGGFNYLSGDDGVLGPDFLIEKDIVLVSFNYRLGPIGIYRRHFQYLQVYVNSCIVDFIHKFYREIMVELSQCRIELIQALLIFSSWKSYVHLLMYEYKKSLQPTKGTFLWFPGRMRLVHFLGK